MQKNMVIRGAKGRKVPYCRIHKGELLFIINNNAEGVIKATSQVINVINPDKLTPDDSLKLVEQNQDKLALAPSQFKRWAGKRYLVLTEVASVK